MKPQRRLRVLHIGKFYPPYMGGIETHVQALCRELQRFAEVTVLVANHDAHSTEEMDQGVRVIRVGTRFNVAGAPITPGMARRIREIPADIVHIHLPNPTAILSYLASGHTGRLVVSHHSDIVRQRVLGRLFDPILRRTLDRCSAIVAATPNHVDSSPTLPSYSGRCRIIPYGISTVELARVDHGEVARLRERFGPRMVLAVGRLVYYKGFDFLIRAMRQVDGHLVVIGDGPLRTSLEETARGWGVADRVTLLGSVPEVGPYLHAADLFVLPSIARSEAFGIVQLEAMACGKPVVNTALDSGVPYVSLDGVTGVTVPPADAGALAGAINRILEDAQLREAFGRAARRRVQEEFSLEVMTERTLRLYGEVMGWRSDAQSQEVPLPLVALPEAAGG